MRHFILAPMGSGKTTFFREHGHEGSGLYDVDYARDSFPQEQLTLQNLASRGDWEAHNQIWHHEISTWANALPLDAVILCHSFADAQAMGATSLNTSVVLLPVREWRRRVLAGRKDVHLANANRHTVLNDAETHALPIFTGFDNALRGLRAADRKSVVAQIGG